VHHDKKLHPIALYCKAIVSRRCRIISACKSKISEAPDGGGGGRSGSMSDP
jgi:hypothetical protein